MGEDTQKLDEVVVTALGIKRSEKALSYNVQKVNNDALTSVKDANFVNSLNGKVAGVNIQRSASGVGGSTRVTMRGNKSISGDNNVLYVVDGVPIGNQFRVGRRFPKIVVGCRRSNFPVRSVFKTKIFVRTAQKGRQTCLTLSISPKFFTEAPSTKKLRFPTCRCTWTMEIL